jgi:hypothetical protein
MAALFVVPLIASSALADTAQAKSSPQAMIADAIKAGPRSVTEKATVKDLKGHVLRQGSNGWTCYPGTKLNKGLDSMCLDAVWEKWMQAYMSKSTFHTDQSGVAYMLAGDSGASNTDPFATVSTEDNQWVVEGAHVMVLVPDAKTLNAISTDPKNGAAYVMWKGTPYAHIMIPVAKTH